jgi:rRNA processing protein Gar1
MHVAQSSGNLILRTKERVRIGDSVYNKKGREIGTIYDIFGPVNEPFLSIRIKNSPEELIGKPLYR